MMSTSPQDSGGSPIPPPAVGQPKDPHSLHGAHSNPHLHQIQQHGGGGAAMNFSPMKTDNNGGNLPGLLSPHHASGGINPLFGGPNLSQNAPSSSAGDLAGSLSLPPGNPGGVPPDLRLSHPHITQWLQQAQQVQHAAAVAAVAAAGGADSGRSGIGTNGQHSPSWIKKDEPKDEPMDRGQSPQSGASSDYANL